MRCPNCRRDIPETALVCGYCGTRLGATNRTTAQPTPSSPATPRHHSRWWIALAATVVLGGGAVAGVVFLDGDDPVATTTTTSTAPSTATTGTTEAACTNVATFIRDTTPDGTALAPGTAFIKTWTLQNSGTCTWTTGYSVENTGGELMGAQASMHLTASVSPGSQIDIAVPMTAPDTEGDHRGDWMLRSDDGIRFGWGEPSQAFWVAIVVEPPQPALAGRIVFSSRRDGDDPELWAMGADGANPIRLTRTAGWDGEAAWAPDGNKVAFVSNRDGDDELFLCVGVNRIPTPTCDADGGHLTQLTANTVFDSGPSWSPDGSKILFASERSGSREIWVMDWNGSHPEQVSDPDAYNDWFAAWSPDAHRMVYVTDRDGNWEIYVMSSNGTGATRLTNDPGRDMWPTWSPDGTKILFLSERDGNPEVYVMAADGSNLVRLTNDPAVEGHPSWSPDGTQILFSSNREGNEELFVMGADGSNPVRITPLGDNDWSPSWNPLLW